MSRTVFLVSLLGLAAAAPDGNKRNLPILFQVQQPNHNIVVFRGADVAKAQAAGLIGAGGLRSGKALPARAPAPVLAPAPLVNTFVPAPRAPKAYVAPAPPPPPRTYRPAPVVTYQPAVVAKPAPVVTYTQPAPIAYKSAPSYQEPVYADADAVYDWEYAVRDDYTGNDFGHKESRAGEHTEGKYYVQLPDGRLQTVTYVVDGYGGYVPLVEYSGEAQYPAPAPAGYGPTV